MKKFSMIGLILAGVFAVLGIGFVTAGVVLGANFSTFCEAVDQGDFQMAHWFEDWEDQTDEWLDDEDDDDWEEKGIRTNSTGLGDKSRLAFDPVDVKKLEIAIKYGTVIIDTTDDTQITVEVEADNEEELIESRIRDGILELTGGSRKLKDYEVRITIPQNAEFAEVEIDMNAASVELEQLYARELEVSVGIGTFTADRIRAEKANLEVGTGELSIEELDSQKIDIETGMGTADVTVLGSQKDYSYEISCGMGALNIGDDSYTALGKEKKLKNNGSTGTIEAECGMGEMSIQFTD